MTTGHKAKAHKVSEAEVDRALSDPSVIADIKKKRTIDRDHDVVYLGGISQSGEVVYIDRHLPRYVEVDGKKIDTDETLPPHEIVEHALMRILGFKYAKAHAIATLVEHRKLEMMGVDRRSYEDVLRPYIRADEHERLKKPPADLYLRPYEDSNDQSALKKLSQTTKR